MRPEFDIANDFFQRTLIKKGFSGNIHWLFRENILVKKGGKGRYKFTLNPDLNEPNEKVKTIYDKLKDEQQRNLLLHIYQRSKNVLTLQLQVKIMISKLMKET